MRRVWQTVLVSMLAAVPVAAQDLGGALNLGQLGASLGVANGIQRQLGTSHASRPDGGGHVSPQPSRLALAPAAAHARLAYRVDPALGQRLLDRYIARIGAREPATAAQLKAIFARKSPMSVSSRWLGRYGMTPTNAADAAAAYLSTAWLIARGNNGDPSRAQITGLRDQMAQALVATPRFIGAGNAAKQEFAQSMLVQAMVNGALLQGASRDATRARAVAAAVAGGVKSSFGIDVRMLRLTGEGFVPA